MVQELTISLERIVYLTLSNAYTLGIIVLIPWIFYFFSLLMPGLLLLGIQPRKALGLPGIVFAPFLHANFNHIFFNTIPLIILNANLKQKN